MHAFTGVSVNLQPLQLGIVLRFTKINGFLLLEGNFHHNIWFNANSLMSLPPEVSNPVPLP